MTLESKLKSVKSYLKSSLIGGIALASSAFGEPAKLESKNGNFDYSITPISNSSSMTGGLASQLLKKNAKIDAKVNVSGKISDGYLELSYSIDNPVFGGFYFNNTETRVFVYAPEGTIIDDIENKKTQAFKGRKIIDCELVPREESNSIVLKMGEKLVQSMIELDPVKRVISDNTLGFINYGLVDEFARYAENRYGRPTISTDFIQNEVSSGGIDIIEVGRGVYPKTSISTREISRKMKLKLRKEGEPIPISVYYKIQVEQGPNNYDDRGKIEAYTTPFMVPSGNADNKLGDLEIWMGKVSGYDESIGFLVYEDKFLITTVPNPENRIIVNKGESSEYKTTITDVMGTREGRIFSLDKEKNILTEKTRGSDVKFFKPKDFFEKFYGKENYMDIDN